MGKILNRLLHGGPKYQARKAQKKLDSETYGTKEWEERSIKDAGHESEFKGRLAAERANRYAHGQHIQNTGGSGLMGKITRTAIALNGGEDFRQPSGGSRRRNKGRQQSGGNQGGGLLGGFTMDIGAMGDMGSGMGASAFNMDGAFGIGNQGGGQRRRRRHKRGRGR